MSKIAKTLSLTSLMSLLLLCPSAHARMQINAFTSSMSAFKRGPVTTFQNGFKSSENRMPGPMDRLRAQFPDKKPGPIPPERTAKRNDKKRRAPDMRMTGTLLRVDADTGATATALTLRRHNKRLSPATAQEYGNHVVEAAKRFGVPVSLLCGIMIMESGGNKMARSSANCVGLMQINYAVHDKAILKAFGHITNEAEVMIPRNNIMVGAWIFSNYLKSENGNVSGALQRYLGGPSASYVARVLQFRKQCVEKMAELKKDSLVTASVS